MTTLLTLSWLVVLAAASLFTLKVWHWYDVRQDWLMARQVFVTSPAFAQARGSMRLAWLRLLDGVLWAGLAVVVLWSGYRNSPTIVTVPGMMVLGRVMILLMMAMEMAKILTDRITRNEILGEMRRQWTAVSEIKELTTLSQKQTRQVIDAVGKGTEAAHAAYKEANSVNIKIENLNKRLLKEEKTDKLKER